MQLSRAAGCIAVAGCFALAAVGCGGGEEKETASASPTPTPSATAPPPNPTGSGPTPGSGLPEEPAVTQRFSGTDGRLSRGRAEDAKVQPGDKSVFMTAVIRRVSQLEGRAGVFCRGGADGKVGYDLTVNRKGDARVERLENGRRTTLQRFRARLDGIRSEDGSEDDLAPLSLSCSTDPDSKRVQIGFVVGVKEVTYVQDDAPFDPPATATAGRVAEGTADFAAFELYAAR